VRGLVGDGAGRVRRQPKGDANHVIEQAQHQLPRTYPILEDEFGDILFPCHRAVHRSSDERLVEPHSVQEFGCLVIIKIRAFDVPTQKGFGIHDRLHLLINVVNQGVIDQTVLP
jgi:hypothetical protein